MANGCRLQCVVDHNGGHIEHVSLSVDSVVSRMSQTMCVEIFSGVQHDFLTKLGLSACITSDDWRGVL